MRNSKLMTVISAVIYGLLVAAEAMGTFAVLRLGMLPDKYVLVFVLALLLSLALLGILMFAHKAGKPVGIARRIIAFLLCLGMIAGCAFVVKVALDANRTMQAVTRPAVKTDARNMYVLVRAEDPAQALPDAAEYTFGIIENYDAEHMQQAIAVLAQELGKDPALKQYLGFIETADALFAEETDALILNGVSVALLLEEEGYEDFAQRVRILRTMPLASLEPTEETTEPAPTEPPVVEKNITNTPFVVYISGSDTRSSILNVSRSDVNILMVVNPETKQVLLLNTPRDYYVPNPAGGGKPDKLTHCGIYGVDCSVEALEGLYGIDIAYHGQINFTGFETLVDAVGGITVYSDQAFKTSAGVYISEGENTLNGEQALSFCRERYRVSGGDNTRGKNQMKVIKAVIQKMTSGTTVISNYASILASLEGMFSTSITSAEIGMLVKMQLEDMASWNIQTYAVTGTGGSAKTYSMPSYYAYVMYPNEQAVAHASKLIGMVLEGKILTEADMNP